jgi:hypothetical protein
LLSNSATERNWIVGCRIAGSQATFTVGTENDSIEDKPGVFIPRPSTDGSQTAGSKV